MPLHFTYEPDEKWRQGADLCQGDVLRRTADLEKILQDIHPHYFRQPNYRYFIVLTQTCDLVQRNGEPCRARYISIAAVRPLEEAIQRAVVDVQYDELERKLGFLSVKGYQKVEFFLGRLLNNNEDDYFFLRAQASQGMAEDGCAFLQLSVALRAHEHYRVLREAKLLQLKDSFQHKLGYLVSKLYGRVGTEDWVPETTTQDEFDQLIRSRLESEEFAIRLPDELHRRVLKRLKALPPAEVSLERFLETVEDEKKAKDRKSREAVDVVVGVLEKQGIAADALQQVRTALTNHADFLRCLK